MGTSIHRAGNTGIDLDGRRVVRWRRGAAEVAYHAPPGAQVALRPRSHTVEGVAFTQVQVQVEAGAASWVVCTRSELGEARHVAVALARGLGADLVDGTRDDMRRPAHTLGAPAPLVVRGASSVRPPSVRVDGSTVTARGLPQWVVPVGVLWGVALVGSGVLVALLPLLAPLLALPCAGLPVMLVAAWMVLQRGATPGLTLSARGTTLEVVQRGLWTRRDRLQLSAVELVAVERDAVRVDTLEGGAVFGRGHPPAVLGYLVAWLAEHVERAR
jgi:hypothetical protein